MANSIGALQGSSRPRAPGRAATPTPPTTTVLMIGLSSSCVLATTAVPTATSSDVQRIATGGPVRLAQLPTGATCIRGPAMSTPSITISVASALLCAVYICLTLMLEEE
jgi:hypothetical protein